MSSTGTTPSEDIRNEVARVKKLLGLDVNRLAIGSEIEGVISNGPFGAIDFTINGINPISFVNVSTTIGPSQTGGIPGDVIPPGQVTGLSATPSSSTQINLGWNNNPESDLANYNVYRGTSAGFPVTLGVTVPVGTPSTNTYNDTGRTASTTYYYKVSAVDSSNNIGALSTEANATTFGGSFVPPAAEFHFDGNYTDTSVNTFPSYTTFALVNGFTAAGQFGSAWQCNTPTTPSAKEDLIIGNPDEIPLRMNTSVGFSFSCWIYPVDLTHAVGMRRFIVEKQDDASNDWSLSIDNAGVLYFFVTKAGITYKRQISGFVINSWQHIGAVFNGATNTVEVYRNGVAGVASVAADILTNTAGPNFHIGNRWSDKNSTYYEGRLDELRYYQVVLTSTQINNLKNTNAP
jgi:concanavalin A-like lectin/glucanase superfamily protein